MLKLLRSDYEQGDLLYFTLAQKTASKTKHLNRERIWKNEGEWTGKFKTGTRKKFLAVGEACLAIFWPTPGFKGRTSVSSGFSTEGTFIFASAVSYCGWYPKQTVQFTLSLVLEQNAVFTSILNTIHLKWVDPRGCIIRSTSNTTPSKM